MSTSRPCLWNRLGICYQKINNATTIQMTLNSLEPQNKDKDDLVLAVCDVSLPYRIDDIQNISQHPSRACHTTFTRLCETNTSRFKPLMENTHL